MLRTSTRLGFAAALNIGLRRASGEIVLLADGSAWPTADALSPLTAALAAPAVAAAGGFGLVTPEQGPLRPNALRRPDSLPAVQDVVALEAGWLAFRRSDYREPRTARRSLPHAGMAGRRGGRCASASGPNPNAEAEPAPKCVEAESRPGRAAARATRRGPDGRPGPDRASNRRNMCRVRGSLHGPRTAWPEPF